MRVRARCCGRCGGQTMGVGDGVVRPRILIIEDEPGIVEFLEVGLAHEGFAAEVARDGASGLRLALEHQPDLVVLDVMLPQLDGFTVCQRLRAASPVPVIMLTARQELPDRVLGLDLGADDYLTKPFQFQELAARIRAVLRRHRGDGGGTAVRSASLLCVQDITLDRGLREARRGPQRLSLTRREYDLLEFLMRHPDQVLTRDVILDRVWGADFTGDGNIIEVYVRYLRQKLGPPSPITTIRGVGYLMRASREGRDHV